MSTTAEINHHRHPLHKGILVPPAPQEVRESFTSDCPARVKETHIMTYSHDEEEDDDDDVGTCATEMHCGTNN
eukprot:3073352-Amphidinium_carterae.1